MGSGFPDSQVWPHRTRGLWVSCGIPSRHDLGTCTWLPAMASSHSGTRRRSLSAEWPVCDEERLRSPLGSCCPVHPGNHWLPLLHFAGYLLIPVSPPKCFIHASLVIQEIVNSPRKDPNLCRTHGCISLSSGHTQAWEAKLPPLHLGLVSPLRLRMRLCHSLWCFPGVTSRLSDSFAPSVSRTQQCQRHRRVWSQ